MILQPMDLSLLNMEKLYDKKLKNNKRDIYKNKLNIMFTPYTSIGVSSIELVDYRKLIYLLIASLRFTSDAISLNKF